MRFPSVNWNELVQSLSTMAVYEFQAWARSVTFVKTTGPYVISCTGQSIVKLLVDLFFVKNEKDPYV